MADSQNPKPGADPSAAFGTIDDLDCRGRRVFLRVDPFVLDSMDDAAATSAAAASPSDVTQAAPAVTPLAAPTSISSLKRLLELEARVVVATHLSPELSAESGVASVEELAAGLSERLGVEALMPDECIGDAAVRVIHALGSGQICVLPDLSGCAGEPKNDEAFARALAGYLDAYVGDAFASTYLEYASLTRLPRLAPRRALGLRARHELGVLSELASASRASVALVLGGSAVSDAIDALRAWLPRLQSIHFGGAAALMLLAASGRAPAHAASDPSRLAEARSLLARARQLDVSVGLPVDLWVQAPGESEARVVAPSALREDTRVLDIGPESVARLSEGLAGSTHVLWWGMLGHPSRGPEASRCVAELCASPERTSVVLGADTRRFVRGMPTPVRSGIDLVSTGTRAAAALLNGRRLPGIEALRIRR